MLDGADIGKEVEKGGSGFISKGGGGNPSLVLGEFVLCRIIELIDGENIPLGGKRGFMPHG
jgi:hypothetical protein